MKRMKDFLGIFKEATDLLQTTSEPTSHLIALLKEEITKNLEDFIEKETIESMKTIGQVTLRNLERRLIIRDEFVIASILDPGQRESNISEKYFEGRNAIDLIKILWNEQFSDDSTPPTSNSQSTEVHGTALACKRMKLLQKHIAPQPRSQSLDLEIEYNQYLAHASEYDVTDVQKFWRDHSIEWPKLSKLAALLLSLSPTSVKCEKAFSTAGILINKRTASLHHSTVQQKLLVHDNYKLLT